MRREAADAIVIVLASRPGTADLVAHVSTL
jgi:hypothetical protein